MFVDFDGVVTSHTFIIFNNCEIQCVLIDTGSGLDIMYYHYFESLGLNPALPQKYSGLNYSFNNQPILVDGVLIINVAFRRG